MPRVYEKGIVKLEVSLNAHDCASCGVVFAIPADLERARIKDGGDFYCPNGHVLIFGPNETEKALKEERAERERLGKLLESQRGWSTHLEESLDAERKQHSTTKGQLTKARKRISGGVCPDCNRHFENVERHMKSKHGGVIA